MHANEIAEFMDIFQHCYCAFCTCLTFAICIWSIHTYIFIIEIIIAHIIIITHSEKWFLHSMTFQGDGAPDDDICSHSRHGKNNWALLPRVYPFIIFILFIFLIHSPSSSSIHIDFMGQYHVMHAHFTWTTKISQNNNNSFST